MLARSGEITDPCGLPVFGSDHSPSSITPAFNHLWINRSMRGVGDTMLHELNQPAFIEVVEKAADISVQNVVHLLLQECKRQRIQRIMLAAPRAKSIREAEKVLFVNLVEDGGHSVLDDFVLQGRDSQWTLP